MEQWRKINFNKNFLISNYGNVKNNSTNELIKQRLSLEGLYKVYLATGIRKTSKDCFVHRLVAEHFLDNPTRKKYVEHIDKIKTNNHYSNLQWVDYPYHANQKTIEEIKILEEEIWKDLQDFEQRYKISNKGRIINKITNTLKTYSLKDGYYLVYLSNGKEKDSKYLMVHKLVAQHFVDNPNKFKIVIHKDRDKLNNDAKNLVWRLYPYENKFKDKSKKDIIKKEKEQDNHLSVYDNMFELWVPIKEYETYMISSYGNIKNVNTNKLLKRILVGSYYNVGLYNGNITEQFQIHRLVAKHFIYNDNPIKKTLIDHVDNNKLNNNASNLRWASQTDNINNYNKYHKPEMDKPILQYNIDDDFIKEWKSIKEIMEHYNYSSGMLYNCLNGICKSAFGYIWKYKTDPINNIELKPDEKFTNIGMFDNHDFSDYEISNCGNVKSLKYNKYMRFNDTQGYYTVMLYDKITGKGIRRQIHRLVAFKFVNGRTKQFNIVNHIDEDKHNNYYKNLEWTDKDGNNKYSFAKKIKQIDIETGQVIKVHLSMGDAIKTLVYGRSYIGHISNCCNGKSRSALGYKWKFA